MVEPKYKRILIKLSGEALAGDVDVGIDIKTVQKMAQEIKEVHELGIEIAWLSEVEIFGVENLLLKQGWIVSKQTTQGCSELS